MSVGDTAASETQREARALGDPTRYRLFRYIAESSEPVSVAELTNFVKLNHNAVRQHLAVLKQAELVVEASEVRDRPGRPSLLYRLHPEAAGKWETPGSYAWLARLFAQAVKLNVSVREIGYREGLRRGMLLGRDEESVDQLSEELTRNGFRPERRDKGAKVEFVLGRCPFEEVATANPAEVCELHLGLAEGLAASTNDLSIDRLVRKDPRRAGCRLVISRRPQRND
ncbi:MAG: helix-turn-helix transcriptional regulator [Acidimicrobiales bacterium]